MMLNYLVQDRARFYYNMAIQAVLLVQPTLTGYDYLVSTTARDLVMLCR